PGDAFRGANVRRWNLEAELAVRRLPTTLFTSGEALFLFQILRVTALSLVDVSTGNASPELAVPVVLDNHEPTTSRALLWRRTYDHCRTPSGIARIRRPAGRADPVGLRG
ncbi:MAG: hypothetical protein WD942_11760, partial [Dehalococcoidia bacterium]